GKAPLAERGACRRCTSGLRGCDLADVSAPLYGGSSGVGGSGVVVADTAVEAARVESRASAAAAGRTGRLDALVLDGDLRQSLVCIRSLGRAGLAAGALACRADAPSFRSRWCR